MNAYVRHVEKTSGVASARAIEALVGAVAGAGAGGALGALTYEPPEALHGKDPQGRRWREGREQLARAGKGALLGALLGAPGGLGATAVRNAMRGRQERLAAHELGSKYLSQLRSISRGASGRVERALPVDAAARDALATQMRAHGRAMGTGTPQLAAETALIDSGATRQAASELLEQESRRLLGLVDAAAKARWQVPFGGLGKERATHKGVGMLIPSEGTHHGQIQRALGLENFEHVSQAGKAELSLPRRYWERRVRQLQESAS